MILTILFIALKAIGAIVLLLWLIYTQWSLRVAKGLKEQLSMQRWFTVVVSLGVFGILTQWIMFFFAYPFRNKKFRPFSWWLDDSRLGNFKGSKWKEDYYIHLNGRKETFWIAYWWHIRNKIWNLQNNKIFKPKPQTITTGNQNIVVTRMINDDIYDLTGSLGRKYVDGIYGMFCGLKYWKDGKSGWQIMNGDKISSKHSLIGKGFYFYNNGSQPKDDNQLNWAYTQTTIVKTWFGGYRWRTIQIGMKQKGYSRQLKYQKVIEIK